MARAWYLSTKDKYSVYNRRHMTNLEVIQELYRAFQYSGRYRLSGKSFRSPAAHVYDIRDGKVCSFRQFTDTKLIWDAMTP